MVAFGFYFSAPKYISSSANFDPSGTQSIALTTLENSWIGTYYQGVLELDYYLIPNKNNTLYSFYLSRPDRYLVDMSVFVRLPFQIELVQLTDLFPGYSDTRAHIGSSSSKARNARYLIYRI